MMKKESVKYLRRFCGADDLAAIIDGVAKALWPAQRAEVSHEAVLVNEGTIVAVCFLCISHHGPGVVDPQRDAKTTAKGSQVLHYTVLVQECMRRNILGIR